MDDAVDERPRPAPFQRRVSFSAGVPLPSKASSKKPTRAELVSRSVGGWLREYLLEWQLTDARNVRVLQARANALAEAIEHSDAVVFVKPGGLCPFCNLASKVLLEAAEDSRFSLHVADLFNEDRDALRDLYVEAHVEAAEFYDTLARQAIGRSPAHVMLLHETDIAALWIADLVAALEANGWTIISADEAYADPFGEYAKTFDTPSAQGTLTEMVAWEAGIPAPRWYRGNDTGLAQQLFDLYDRNQRIDSSALRDFGHSLSVYVIYSPAGPVFVFHSDNEFGTGPGLISIANRRSCVQNQPRTCAKFISGGNPGPSS